MKNSLTTYSLSYGFAKAINRLRAQAEIDGIDSFLIAEVVDGQLIYICDAMWYTSARAKADCIDGEIIIYHITDSGVKEAFRQSKAYEIK